jgi:hypothetical protein
MTMGLLEGAYQYPAQEYPVRHVRVYVPQSSSFLPWLHQRHLHDRRREARRGLGEHHVHDRRSFHELK